MYQQTGTSVISANPHPTGTVTVLKVRKGHRMGTFFEYSYIYSLSTYLFKFYSVPGPGNVLVTKTDEVLGELTEEEKMSKETRCKL